MVYSWQTNLLYPMFSGGGPRAKTKDDGDAPNYFTEGFIPVQTAIALAYASKKCIETDCKNISESTVQMQRFPYPPYEDDLFLIGLEGAVGLFIMLSFVYSIISTVRFIALEKEKQLKEVMKIMGMPIWLHWTSWFVRTMIFVLISITAIVGLLKVNL